MTPLFTDYIDSTPTDQLAIADHSISLTYGRLRTLALSAAGFIHQELGSGNYVVIKALPSSNFLVTLFGILYSGNTPVPVDPKLPEHALDYILRKCDASLILAPLEFSQYQGLAPLHSPDPSQPALVMFTSGTTGFPKGVVMSHANLIHSCSAVSEYLSFREHASTIAVLPLHYSYGLISQVLCQLFVGGYVRLFPDLHNPVALEKVVNNESIETFCGVPSSFLALGKIHRLKTLRLSSVKIVCSAGADFDLNLYDAVKEIFPNATVFNNYGMTEACPRIAYVADTDPRFFHGSCGKPMSGVELGVVDPVTYQIIPDRAQGILTVRGPNITTGYLYDEQRTKAAFTKDGFLITGDIAHLEEGYIYLHGRSDDIFNVAGEKVSPLEIENALNALPEVDCSAVRGFPDTIRGSAPVAFLVLRSKVSKKSLDVALMARLTANKIPIEYYEVEELPMTSNGKIQRRLLDRQSTHVIREIS